MAEPADYSVAVWKDCEKCKGSGTQKNHLIDGTFWEDCDKCKGDGKRPTFISLRDVTFTHKGPQPDMVTALSQWLIKRED